jgi:integrase/recombinase XerD
MTTTQGPPEANYPLPAPFESACTDYLNHLRYERAAAKTTVYTYSSWLTSFRRWLEGNDHPAADLSVFTPAVLRTYQYSLSARSLRPRTIRAAFHPLRGLAEFLITHKVITENPCKSLTMPKKDAAKRLTISQAEIVALLGGAERLHPQRRALLARAWLSILVYTGLRFQEALDLKVGDINMSAGSLLVSSGKGSKSRLLYPPKPCLEAVQAWLDVREQTAQRQRAFQHDWLFAENAGRRIGNNGIRDLLAEIKAAANLRGHNNIQCHSIRHFFATTLDQNGAPLKVTQAALGHASAAQTLVYIHAAESDARRMGQYAVLPLLDKAREPTAGDAEGTERKRQTRISFQQKRRGRSA